MKKIFITLITLSLVLSCSGDDDGGATRALTNEALVAPGLVFPTQNLTCTNFNLEFTWNSISDPEGDDISYIIDISTDNNFGSISFTAVTTEALQAFTLEKGVTYYWRVKARDSEGNESDYSTTQSFFTEPDAGINTIPYAPTAVTPLDGATPTGNTVSLAWDTTDADGDTLVYDVYFGETNPPQLTTENITTTNFDVSVASDTQYYWRVVVKDSNQGTTIGQVWNFRTE
ncbi:hypothetical protein [Aquimarina mytili]|uniref:Fibronectin type-III domain-containing protein n=1 Tax=Aquimarina mytili TaxID=874423 RepID=A0A936ZSE7_9FLAO|nr:hypothetical protein [Aquimarina mytili]MBL0684764.1 hypothetical protein [Aquimarina mytili]